MNIYFSMIFLFFIVVIAIGMVLGIGNPLISATIDTVNIGEAETALKFFDHAIKEIAQEGEGAGRLLEITIPGDFVVMPEEDSIQYNLITGAEIFEHFSRKNVGNLFFISGADVDCDDISNLTMTNTFINVTLNKVARTEPLSSINTADNIISVKGFSGTEIALSDSSIVINGNATSSYGNGYSEIVNKGKHLSYCKAHFYINSSYAIYDIYYTLYSGADFLVIDVLNIIEK